MHRYKVCVYAISKNEEQFVDRWMNAVSEADQVVVLDTGSSDGTVEVLRSRGAVVYQEEIKPWRFDAARNRAMDHVPEDMDICVSNDLDEVFQPGWRALLEAHWNPSCTRARYRFAWSHLPDGAVEKTFTMEKIHCRKGFRWVRPVHEILEYSGDLQDHTVDIPGLLLHHYPDSTKPRSQYLPLLELSVEENPADDRATFWLGREYLYERQYDKAIPMLKRHLELPAARWAEERSASMRYIAKGYERLGNWMEAEAWLHRAAAECPGVREAWLELARLGYLREDWALSFYAAERGLTVTQGTGSYLVEPAAWGDALDDYAAIACYRLGLYQKALEHAQRACAISPANERLRENVRLIREQVEGGRAQ